MKKVTITALCIAALGGASAFAQNTTAEKAAMEEFAKYTQTGEFTKCINHNRIKKTTIVDDQKIMFEMRNNTVLLSTLARACSNLGFYRQFNYVASGNKICSKDMISTVRGSCSLGKFETLEKKS